MSPPRIEYRVIAYTKGYNDPATDAIAEEEYLNTMGLNNWQLTAYNNGVMYFSRLVADPAVTSHPARHTKQHHAPKGE